MSYLRTPLLTLAAGAPCIAAVMVYGELSAGALVAVVVTGTALAAVALARRAGESAAPVARRTTAPWLGWLLAGAVWELLTLVTPVATPSDVADRLLVHPPVRGAATAGWLLGGSWLLTRPGRRERTR